MIRSKVLPLALFFILVSFWAGAALAREVPTVSAKDFWLEFETDRAAAEAGYVGKTLNFTGVVVKDSKRVD